MPTRRMTGTVIRIERDGFGLVKIADLNDRPGFFTRQSFDAREGARRIHAGSVVAFEVDDLTAEVAPLSHVVAVAD